MVEAAVKSKIEHLLYVGTPYSDNSAEVKCRYLMGREKVQELVIQSGKVRVSPPPPPPFPPLPLPTNTQIHIGKAINMVKRKFVNLSHLVVSFCASHYKKVFNSPSWRREAASNSLNRLLFILPPWFELQFRLIRFINKNYYVLW